MTKYQIEHTPAGRGFAYGGTVRECDTWEEAISGAMIAAANCDHPTIYWAVEREIPVAGSAASPVVREKEFGSPSLYVTDRNYTSKAAAALGKKGGQVKGPKGFSTMDPARRSEIAKAAAAKHWAKPTPP